MPCCCSSNVQAAWILGIIAIILNLVELFPLDDGAIFIGVISALVIQGTVIVVWESRKRIYSTRTINNRSLQVTAPLTYQAEKQFYFFVFDNLRVKIKEFSNSNCGY